MPNEEALKGIIRKAIFEAHNTHGNQASGAPLFIAPEDSMVIANAVYDALKVAGALVLDGPKSSN